MNFLTAMQKLFLSKKATSPNGFGVKVTKEEKPIYHIPTPKEGFTTLRLLGLVKGHRMERSIKYNNGEEAITIDDYAYRVCKRIGRKDSSDFKRSGKDDHDKWKHQIIRKVKSKSKRIAIYKQINKMYQMLNDRMLSGFNKPLED